VLVCVIDFVTLIEFFFAILFRFALRLDFGMLGLLREGMLRMSKFEVQLGVKILVIICASREYAAATIKPSKHDKQFPRL